MASHGAQPFLERTRNLSHKFLMRLKAESLKNCPRNSAGPSPAFWVFCLDEFLLNPRVWTHSGTFLGTSRNTDAENQEPTGDHSENDPHPEVESSVYQSRNAIDSDPEGASLR